MPISPSYPHNAYLYELTPEAEDLFLKAYGLVLRRLLDIMIERLGLEEAEALLRAVGRRIADEHTRGQRAREA